jgi:hypothetical protein
MGFLIEQSRRSEVIQEKYVRFFDKPLERNDVVALAAFLGKEVLPDVQNTPLEEFVVA